MLVGRPGVALDSRFKALRIVHLVAVPCQYVILNARDVRAILGFANSRAKVFRDLKARGHSGLLVFNE